MRGLLILSILTLLQYAHSTKTRAGKVCPILGPSYPQPSNLNSYPTWQKAMQAIEHEVDQAKATGENRFGEGEYNKTTFSLTTFSVYDEGLLWQQHYTDPSVAHSQAGVHHVDANTLYQIGSTSKLFTAYMLLIVDGDSSFNQPITKYLPQLAELADASSAPNGVLPQWDQISVGDFATHLGGITEDYGLDDIEFSGSRLPDHIPGFPALPKSRIPKCNTQLGANSNIPCTVKEIIEGLATMPAQWASGVTPLYSNAGYDLVGAVIESITGVNLSQTFYEKFAKPLNLTQAYFYPPDPSLGAIPFGVNQSGWNAPLAATIPDGGYFFSTNDMAVVGKSILNSTLLPVPLTRRWMKPRTFTSDPTGFVGAPWEIYRWETPNRLYDIYTKEGEVGLWSTMFGLIPDLGLGFNAFSAGAGGRPDEMENLANMVAAHALPAAQEVARQQAEKNFAGKWATSDGHVQLTISTDEQPALKLTHWISNATNILDSVDAGDSRLWPNQLYTGNKVSFFASFDSAIQTPYAKRPLKENCLTYVGDVGNNYGNVGIGSFVFDVDSGSGEATSLRLEAFEVTLTRVSGGNSTNSTNSTTYA